MSLRIKLLFIIIYLLLGFGLIIGLNYYSNSIITSLEELQNNGLFALASVERLGGWTAELLVARKNHLDAVFIRWKSEYSETEKNVTKFILSPVLKDLFTGTKDEHYIDIIINLWNNAKKKLIEVNNMLEDYNLKYDMSTKGGLLNATITSGDEDAFLAYVLVNELQKLLYDSFDYKYRELIELVDIKIKHERNSIGVLSSILISLTILIILLSSFLFVNQIISKIRKVEKAIRSVSCGDFDVKLSIKSNDEFGVLARNFNFLLTDLVKNVDSILSCVEVISNSIHEDADLDTIKEKILESIINLTNADSGIFIDLKENNIARLTTIIGDFPALHYSEEIIDEAHLHFYSKEDCIDMEPEKGNNRIFQKIGKAEKNIFIKHTSTDKNMINHVKVNNFHISSLLAIPIYISHQLYGILSLIKRKPCAFFTHLDYTHAISFSDYISIMLEKRFGKIKRDLEKAKIEKEKCELKEQLRQAQKMEALGTLAGGIAHDFKNILSQIICFTEMTREMLSENNTNKIAGNNKIPRYLTNVLDSAYRASDLVKQILAFSRQNKVEFSTFNISPIIKETVKLLKASFPSNIVVKQDIQDEMCLVIGSPAHVHQVILNLITNAYQEMIKKGGNLNIVLCEENINDEMIMSNDMKLKPGRYLKFSVADTGPGIRPDILPNIFDPYFTTKKERGGTGLGLSIVHGIVNDMGGFIKVESEFGKGTRFDVYFPVIEDLTTELEKEPYLKIETGTESVVIVDDELTMAEIVGAMINSLGYKTKSFTKPSDAIEYITENRKKIDLIISDFEMQDMTGVELAKTLQKIKITIPLILYSENDKNKRDWEKATAKEVKAFVMKPIVKSKLAMTVRQVLDGKN